MCVWPRREQSVLRLARGHIRKTVHLPAVLIIPRGLLISRELRGSHSQRPQLGPLKTVSGFSCSHFKCAANAAARAWTSACRAPCAAYARRASTNASAAFTAFSRREERPIRRPHSTRPSSRQQPPCRRAAGLVIVGLTGHLTTTALGRSLPGSTSSMVSVWPLRLPLDSGVTSLMGDLDSFRSCGLDLLARRVFQHLAGTSVS
jgi:hypothetical protein